MADFKTFVQSDDTWSHSPLIFNQYYFLLSGDGWIGLAMKDKELTDHYVNVEIIWFKSTRA